MDNTLNQLYEAMTFLYGGFGLGIVYELLDAVIRHCKRRVLPAVCDAFFALLLTLCAAVCFLIANGGVLRLYGFVILFVGWLCARWAFHPLLHMI